MKKKIIKDGKSEMIYFIKSLNTLNKNIVTSFRIMDSIREDLQKIK